MQLQDDVKGSNMGSSGKENIEGIEKEEEDRWYETKGNRESLH